MLVATLVVVGLVLGPAGAQRRRERTRGRSQNDESQQQQTVPRKLFDESESKGQNGFERTNFFPEFDWSDPSFTDMSAGAMPEWGFKKARGVTVPPNKAVENIDYKESSAPEQVDTRKVVRNKVPAVREFVKDRADRRSDIGTRRRVRPGRFPKTDDRKLINDRVRTVNRFRQKETDREDQLDDVEEFKIPSNVDIVNPVSLSINPVKILEKKEKLFGGAKVIKEDHPGSLSFGIFGGGNIGGEESSPRQKFTEVNPDRNQVTTYRPSNYLPANFKVTTYRPKNFQPIGQKFKSEPEYVDLRPENNWNENGWRRNSFERESNNRNENRRPIPPVKENTEFYSKTFKPSQNPLRSFVEKSPIRPQRWKPQTKRPSYNDERRLGSPFFTLDREEVDPDYVSRESEQEDLYTNEDEFDIKEEITRPKSIPAYTKYEPPIKKQTIFLPTLMPPEEDVQKQQFQPTLKSTLEPTIEEYANDKILNIDFLSERDEPIENVFIPTQMSTTEKAESISNYPTSYTSSRDAERRSDIKFNKKKIQEEIEASTPNPLNKIKYPSGGINSRNDERFKDQKFNVVNSKNRDETEEIEEIIESPTTPKFEVNRAFMEGRQRSTASTARPNSYDNPEDNFWNILEDNNHEFNPDDFSTSEPEIENLNIPLENLSDENAYSKTHMRTQKIRPSFDYVDEDEKESDSVSFQTLPPIENLSDPMENLSEENSYSKTHIRKQKTRPRNPSLTLKEKEIENDIIIDEKNEKIEGTKLEGMMENKGNNYGKTLLNVLKTRDGGKIDYMHLKMADITKEIPLSKLKIILNKNGFSPSDIFNKVPKALEVVGKAMKSKSYLDEPEVQVEKEPVEDIYKGLDIKVKEWEKEPEEDIYKGLDIKVKEWKPSESFDFSFGDEKEEETKFVEENLYEDDVVEKTSSIKKEIKIPWPKRPKTSFRNRYASEENENEGNYKNSFVPQKKKEVKEKEEDNYIPRDLPRRTSWANRNKDLKAEEDDDNEDNERKVSLTFPKRKTWGSRPKYGEEEETIEEPKEDREEYPRRISWANRGKENENEYEEKKKDIRKDAPRRSWNNRKKEEKVEDNDVSTSEADIDAEIEAEASTMSFKSLVKKISPMSLSEVLAKVGFSLPDVMRGNKEAIKQVLKFHRKATGPTTKKPVDKKGTEDPYEGLNIKINEWKPDTTLTETTTPKAESTTTTEKTTTARSRGKSSINIFRNSNLFKNLRASTTVKSTTVPDPSTTSSSFRFGERTSKKNLDKPTPTNIKNMKSRQKTKKYLPTPDTISERNDEFLDETTQEEATDTADTETTVAEVESTTTPYASLNMTLANLNMTADDVKERKDLTVPGLDQIFIGLTKKESEPDSEIIYGAKPAFPKDKPEKKRKARPKTYKNTDFGGAGGGGVRFRWDSPSSFGGGGGGLVTNRRTTRKPTTTKIPITYFSLDGEADDESITNEILNGDYNGVVDYDYYQGYEYYNEPAYEVPSGVKSALIASSVVGGLAVSIFLCIFMLCLWKQMKSKLRMGGEFEDHNKAGFLSSLFFKKTKVSKKEAKGYFNKVPPINEQHYSTTSSEEY